jgi:Fis family transcriptional regulator, factor for inversion stimulation protein
LILGKKMLISEKALKSKNNLLQKSVSTALIDYLSDLDGEDPSNLYETVLREIEKPLLSTVMNYCENNQSRAASCLGINRGTLRKKLKQHQITQ